MLWTIMQAISGIGLGAVSLLPCTYDPDKKPPLRPLGWVLLACFSGVLILSISVGACETVRDQERLREQLAEIHDLNNNIGQLRAEVGEIRDKLFTAALPRVMESKPSKILSVPTHTTGGIQIISPTQGSTVLARSYLEGRISDIQAQIWVIVHPVGTGAYWVQPAVSIKEDGSWKCQMYLGRTNSVDVGKHFEIIAIAYPIAELQEAEVLDRIPDSRWRSEIIEVVRR